MPRTRKLVTPVTLFAAIEQEQHEALRQLAFAQRRSLADVTRDALTAYIKQHAPAKQRRAIAALGGTMPNLDVPPRRRLPRR